MELAQALAQALGVEAPKTFEEGITVHLTKGEKVINCSDRRPTVKKIRIESCEICGEKGDLYDRHDLVVCQNCL